MAMSKEAACVETNVETSSDAEKEILCVPCLDVGEHRLALKYCIDCADLVCQNCVDYHRRFKQMKEHKLVDIREKKDLKLSMVVSRLLLCQNHPDKSIELVCMNHDALCCLTCATVNHRGCSSVVGVAREASDLKKTHAADELKSNLSVAEGYITNIVKRHEKCKHEFIASTEVLIPNKLQELKQKLMQAFDVLEESIRLDGNEQRIKYTAKHDVEKEKWAMVG